MNITTVCIRVKNRGIAGLIAGLMLMGLQVSAQQTRAADTLTTVEEQEKPDRLRLNIYMRVISDAKGAVRLDENIVPNFLLGKWLRGEAGIRFGQRPGNIQSYYHYKLELQTKYVRKTARVLARLADDIINYPSPDYRKTNAIFALELRSPVWHSLQVLGGGGYVFSAVQNNKPDALPVDLGKPGGNAVVRTSNPIFRLSLRYTGKKGFVEGVFGSYDVFNTYEINRPFLQAGGEYELSRLCTFTSYFRYQYDYNVFSPFNYFFSVGLVLHLSKGPA